MTPELLQRREALLLANDRRREVAAIKRELRTGVLTLAEAMATKPQELRDVLLVDVIRWSRRTRSAPSTAHLGNLAMSENVNLLMTVGKASARSRAWVAENGDCWRPKRLAA